MARARTIAFVGLLCLAAAVAIAQVSTGLPGALITGSLDAGFRDTPLLPGGRWHVHDPDRPKPRVVVPGEAGAPPSDAVLLFAGDSLAAFQRTDGQPADWPIKQGALVVPVRGKDLRTRERFGDVQLHLEFDTPPPAGAKGQMRGNSGVFLMGLYEVQILDSWQSETYADGQASAIYGWKPPLVNASRPPGQWQSYDILFERPRFDPAGKLLRPAYVSVLHNGVATQVHQRVLGASRWRQLARYEAHPDALPIVLQDHGVAVAFRNIWARRLELEPDPAG